MKRAVIVVGSHFSGKSKTINKYLKNKLGISEKSYIFHLDGERGLVRSKSLEEAGSDIEDFLKRCREFHYVVLACRPSEEKRSHQATISNRLAEMNFSVSMVEVLKGQSEKYYQAKAGDAFAALCPAR